LDSIGDKRNIHQEARMKQKNPTIYDIATAAGVSTATVSRVMAGHPNVSAKTRARVLEIIDSQSYRPNLNARALELGMSRILGIVSPSMANPYFAAICHGAAEEAHKSDYLLLPQSLLPDERIGTKAVERFIAQRLGGLLFISGPPPAPHHQVVSELTLLQKYMPVVVLSPPIEGFACTYLYNDLTGAMRQAIRHLQALGHRRIAFLGGSTEISTSGIRGRLFLEELAALNLMPEAQYHHEAGHTPEAGELAVLKMLSRLAQPAWPTALIAINDLVALGALRQLHRMGLRVPDDMAVIGCDNQFFAAFTTPPLTTIDLQAAEHARIAIQVLLGEQGPPAPPFTQVREATLIVRESCGVKLGRRAIE